MNPTKPTLVILLAAAMLASPVAVAASASNPHVDDETGETDPRTEEQELVPNQEIPDSVDIDNAWITHDSVSVKFHIQVDSLFVPHTLSGAPFPAPRTDTIYEFRVDVPGTVFTEGPCAGDNPELWVELIPENGVLWPPALGPDPIISLQTSTSTSAHCASDAGDKPVKDPSVNVDRGTSTITLELPRSGTIYELNPGITLSNPSLRTYEDNFLNGYLYDTASSDAQIDI